MFPYKLYLLTDEKILGPRPLIDTVEAAVRGGVDLVQYRNKTKSIPDQIEEAGRLKERLDRLGVPLIINDHSKVAHHIQAAGVHLGQTDQPILEVRAYLPTAWIGVSTHSIEQAKAAADAGATYIGFGPMFATATKTSGLSPVVGPVQLRALQLSVPVAVFPIGGITLDNVDTLLAAGAHRVALISAILAATDPELAARSFKERLDKKRAGRYGAEP